MQIDITQYMRPDGRTKMLQIEIPDEYEAVINKLKELDLRITCELLSSGLVAQYITHEEGDYAIELDMFGEGVNIKLLKMLDDFDEQSFKSWLKIINKEGEE